MALYNVGVRGLGEEEEIGLQEILGVREVDVLVVPEHWRGAGERLRRTLRLPQLETRRKEVVGLLGDKFEWFEQNRSRAAEVGWV